jgi:hypothetical protein
LVYRGDYPRIHAYYIHSPSPTRGEEADGPPVDSPKRPVFLDRLQKWAKVMGNNKKKAMLVSSADVDLDESIKLGFGQRGGFVENYLYILKNKNLGLSVNPQGYIEVDETVPMIAQARRSGDENEAYSFIPLLKDRFGGYSSFTHRYRESVLRIMQMRRTNFWTENVNGYIETPLLQMAALSIAKDVTNTADAWVYLRQSNLDPSPKHGVTMPNSTLNPSGTIPIKNFERWLYQRDDANIRTDAVVAKGQGGKQLYRADAEEYDYVARRTKRAAGSTQIGFALDDRFISGNSPAVAIKVTYLDSGNDQWELRYTTQQGQQATRKMTNQNTGEFKTVTWIVNDAKFAAQDKSNDFFLATTTGDLTASFVRVIKLNEPASVPAS